MKYKKCVHCKKIKPLSEFYNNSKSADGKTSWCKACMKEASAKMAGTEYRKAKMREYYWRREKGRKKVVIEKKLIPLKGKANIEGYKNFGAAIILKAFEDIFSREDRLRESAKEYFRRGYYIIAADVLGIPHEAIINKYHSLLRLRVKGNTPGREQIRLL